MSMSFDGVSFLERSDGTGYATWAISGNIVPKKIPGSDDTVIQIVGAALPRVTILIAGSAAQMAALQGKVGVSGSLVFTFETTTARLVSMEPPVSIGIGNDLYFSSLELIRSSSTFVIPSTAWLTQSGEPWGTQDGDVWSTQ